MPWEEWMNQLWWLKSLLYLPMSLANDKWIQAELQHERQTHMLYYLVLP
jgi:hypothetical protein